MKYFCETISADLARKLKEKGMPMALWKKDGFDFIEVIETRKEIFDESLTYEVGVRYEVPLYSEVLDWFMEKDVYIRIEPFLNKVKNCYWSWYINQEDEPRIESDFYFDSWHKAANAAIEKALTLI